jgi:hypothetical protein
MRLSPDLAIAPETPHTFNGVLLDFHWTKWPQSSFESALKTSVSELMTVLDSAEG